MFQPLWETHASWHEGKHPMLSDYPSTCCHCRAKPLLLEDTAPRPFMRPISSQASRSQEENTKHHPLLSQMYTWRHSYCAS